MVNPWQWGYVSTLLTLTLFLKVQHPHISTETEGCCLGNSLQGQCDSSYKGPRKERTIHYSSLIEEKYHPGFLFSTAAGLIKSHSSLLVCGEEFMSFTNKFISIGAGKKIPVR